MINLSIPTKKDISKILNYLNEFLTRYLSVLNLKNFNFFFRSLLYDKRFGLTFGIILISIFAHLSTPAFYKDEFVIDKVKKFLEKEYDIQFSFSEDVSYSIFPVPSFYLKNINLSSQNKNIGNIGNMKVNLSFKKFFDKNKMNIQNVKITDSKFELLDEHIVSLIKYFDKEINNKKLVIEKSDIFLKNNNDEIYSILKLRQSYSIFNIISLNNELKMHGEIFNVPLEVILRNNYLTKKTFINFNLKGIKKEIKLYIDYLNSINTGKIELKDISNTYLVDLEFNDRYIKFNSPLNHSNELNYNGLINLNPFYSNLEFNFLKLDILDMIKNGSLFFELLSSKIFFNNNLNYRIRINSKNIKNNRKFNNLNFILNFDQRNMNFDNSNIKFDESVNISILNSKFVSNDNKIYLSGEILIDVIDDKKLYKYFQTNKKYRKNLDNINLKFMFDYINQKLIVDKIIVNNKATEKIDRLTENYNWNEIKSLRRIEIKKFFNSLAFNLD